MKGLIFTCLFMLIISLSYADCDMMALLAKNGFQISGFTEEPQYDTEDDYDDADDFFQFQIERSCEAYQEDGYGVIYYKNGQYLIPFDHADPLNENNQAYHLFGEFNHSWYQHHGPSGQTEFPQPEFPGYYWNDSNYQSDHPSRPDYEWINITGIGTQVTFPTNDDGTELIPIGFQFTYYENDYDQFRINPNGWIGFANDNTAYLNDIIPSTGAPRSAIFGFWDDLNPNNDDPNASATGDVYYHSNNERLVVWFDDVIHWDESGTYNFQIIIFSTGEIIFQYNEMNGILNSATIGIQNAAGDDGLQVVYDSNFTNDDSYVENELAVLFSTEAYPEPLDISEERIMISNNNAVIVLGHDRNRADPISSDAVSQHPFRFIWDDITYTFQHNGYHDYKEAMRWYCLQHNQNWFDIYPLNWEIYGSTIDDLSTVNDTEILFHYIMAHVIEYNGNIVGGMISALNETAVYDDVNQVYLNFHELFQDDGTNKINITLSDGEALYVFRNTGLSGSNYNLSYKDYENGFVGIKTQGTIPDGSQIQQYSLVVIPREGDIVTYENIFDLDAKTYSFPNWWTLPDAGWKWLSFDILDPEANNQAQYFIAPISAPNELDIAWFKPHSPNSESDYISYTLGFWHNGTHPITSPYGYKFHTFTDCQFTVIGERCPAETTFPLFGNNQENWIGYFLEETQYIYEAFAEYLDNLTGIRAQHWAIKKENGIWPPIPPYTISPGDMVIAYCETDVPAFSWNFEESREKYVIPESQNFTYEEQADYIPVFIELDPNDLPSEIGAYVDGECKGATVVQDTSAQICAYILENQGENLEFEFSYGSRELNKQIKEYGIYEPETSKTVKGTIQIDNSRDCYYVSFKGKQNYTPAPAKIEISNFPNPFNPETILSFSLPKEQEIELTVYNLKGQKVSQLARGQFPAGEHSVVWSGKDNNGKQVSSGLYFYKLKTNEKVISKKMLLLK